MKEYLQEIVFKNPTTTALILTTMILSSTHDSSRCLPCSSQKFGVSFEKKHVWNIWNNDVLLWVLPYYINLDQQPGLLDLNGNLMSTFNQHFYSRTFCGSILKPETRRMMIRKHQKEIFICTWKASSQCCKQTMRHWPFYPGLTRYFL